MATYLDTKLRVKIVVLIQYNYKDYKSNAELRVAKGNLFKSYIKLQVIHFFDTGNWILQSECWQVGEFPSWLSQICPKHPRMAPPYTIPKGSP